MKALTQRERTLLRTRRSGARLKESKLTLALAALKLASCHGVIVKSRVLARP